MRAKPDDYRLSKGEPVDLKQRPTITAPLYSSTDEYHDILGQGVERLSRLQHLLYASESRALLIIFQGMDSAGKDGAIRHVMSGVNPQGCEVYSFKQPSAEELQHDFLWRCQVRLPERGRIGIFNRSYYEEVLVVRVHPELLAAEGLAAAAANRKGFWNERFESIHEFERHLSRNGTRLVKIFLHLSKEEQRRRFLARIEEPHKNWKFSMADIAERKRWKHYMNAYEACLALTSSSFAPWFVVPADDKQNARLIVSEIVIASVESMKLKYPEVSAERLAELRSIKKQLER
jgi:PPK2 family polyphosphate:nucleotide phosphotransferase